MRIGQSSVGSSKFFVPLSEFLLVCLEFEKLSSQPCICVVQVLVAGRRPSAVLLDFGELVFECCNLCERIIERLQPWKEAGKRGEVGSMLLGVQDPAVLELFAQEML